jgi:hypothetical protein
VADTVNKESYTSTASDGLNVNLAGSINLGLEFLFTLTVTVAVADRGLALLSRTITRSWNDNLLV